MFETAQLASEDPKDLIESIYKDIYTETDEGLEKIRAMVKSNQTSLEAIFKLAKDYNALREEDRHTMGLVVKQGCAEAERIFTTLMPLLFQLSYQISRR